MQTDADDVFVVEVLTKKRGNVIARSKYTGEEHEFEASHLKPFLKGSLNIRRYALTDLTKRLIFPYEIRDGAAQPITATEYERTYPLTWSYLEACRTRLTARAKGNFADYWHGYVYKKNHTRFEHPKLLVPAIGTGVCFAADLEGHYYFVGSGGGGYGISLNAEEGFSQLYLLGLLNSKVLDYFLRQIATPFRGGYIALTRQFIEQLPIRSIDARDSGDRAEHDALVALVERILEVRRADTAVDTSEWEREIDERVYRLYGLTKEEISVVESSSKER